MAMFSTLDDRDVDRLLAGMPSADRDLAPLAELAAFLRRSAAAEPAPPMGELLRAQLRGAPVVAIAARKANRSLVKAGAAAAAVVAVVGMGVGASQNRLPAGLQDVLSSTANLVGIHVPTVDERSSHSNGSDGDNPAPNADSGDPGYEGTTPGGVTPADPGTPGDKEPATPATPPEQSNGTPQDNNGKVPEADGTPGQSEATTPPASAPAPTVAPEEPVAQAPDSTPPEEAPSTEPVGAAHGSPSANGTANGQGTVSSESQGSERAEGAGPPSTVTAAGHGPPATTTASEG
ncbi:MAG: hypothetical protein ACRDZU_07755, partial [Acidimicrobiales bacterium]